MALTDVNLFRIDGTVGSIPSADIDVIKNSASASNNIVLNSDGTTTLTPNNIIKSGTSVASTSGTSIDFTGIPSWVKRVTVMFNGVSTNGTSYITVRVGTSGGVISSGYITGNWSVTTAVASSVANSSTGFEFIVAGAGSVQQGAFVLSALDATAWIGQGSFYDNNPTVRMAYVTGRVTGLASALDRIRITTVNGTDTFDGGSINILWEG